MRFEQLEYLLEVARYQSMSKAAKKLFLTQPTLSSSINSLEQELGIKIFNRNTNGVQPTELGNEVLVSAQSLLKEYYRLKELSSAKEEIQGNVHIAAYPASCIAVITETIHLLKEFYPKINLYIHEIRPYEGFNAIKNGRLLLP